MLLWKRQCSYRYICVILCDKFTSYPGTITVGFSKYKYETTESIGNVMVCVDVLTPVNIGALRPFTVALLPKEGTITTYNVTCDN